MIKQVSNNRMLNYICKAIICILLAVVTLSMLITEEKNSLYGYQNYEKQYVFGETNPEYVDGAVIQTFQAKGNRITNVSVYYEEYLTDTLTLTLQDELGEAIKSVTVVLSDQYYPGIWNQIAFDYVGCKRDSVYAIKVESSGDISRILGAGINETYRYMPLGNRFVYGIKWLRTLAILFGMCYAIWFFEKLWEEFNRNKSEKMNKNILMNILYSLYFSVSFILFYNPIDGKRLEPKGFDRIIGAGYTWNVDVTLRVHNFTVWFILFAISFGLIYLLVSHLSHLGLTKDAMPVKSVLDHFMVIAGIDLLLHAITFFFDKEHMGQVFYYSFEWLFLIIVSCVVYLLLGLYKKVSAEWLCQIEIAGFCIAYPIAILLPTEWMNGKVLIGLQYIILAVLLIVSAFIPTYIKQWFEKDSVRVCVVGLSLLPLLTSCYMEGLNILNQWNIFVPLPRRSYVLLLAGYVCVIVLVFVLSIKKMWRCTNWKVWSYCFILIGAGCFFGQIPLEATHDVHLFEQANSSILITDFLNFGKIPLVEHYGGHMLTDVIGGIVYAVLNRDPVGAAFTPYSKYIMVAYAVLFFLLLRKIWNDEAALLTTLVFPFYTYFSYYGLGILACFAIIAFVKKSSWQRALILWLVLIGLALYRLDLGMAYMVAVIVALAIYIVIYRQWKALMNLIIPLVGCGIVGVSLWFGLCIAVGVSPIDRLLEFIGVSLSNINWAYGEIGDTINSIFSWMYLGMPIVIICILLYVVCAKNFRERIGLEKWMLLQVMGFNYFANYSRGLVRHSLSEMSTETIMWTGYLFLTLFIVFLSDRRKLFLPVFTAFILMNVILAQNSAFMGWNLVDKVVERIGDSTDGWFVNRFVKDDLAEGEVAKTRWLELYENQERVNRIAWSDGLTTELDGYRIVLDTLLEDNETFVDLINKTFVYSALGYRNPVYVSQSPMQLSGEFSQEMFVKEMAGVPLVLMPVDPENSLESNSLDSFSNAYRYYKVMEYVYQNYVPLCKYGNQFAVWCLREKYDSYITKVESIAEPITYGYDGPFVQQNENGEVSITYLPAIHDYSLRVLPQIWAERDQKNAVDNMKLCELIQQDGYYRMEEDVDKSLGNYLLIHVDYSGKDQDQLYGENDESIWATVKLGYHDGLLFEELYQYQICLAEGAHDYLIRVSNDYYWYLNQVNAVDLTADELLHGVKMSILQGD